MAYEILNTGLRRRGDVDGKNKLRRGKRYRYVVNSDVSEGSAIYPLLSSRINETRFSKDAINSKGSPSLLVATKL